MSVRIGLQLYSVRQALATDPWGTLEAISRAGFRYIEAANHNATTDPGVGFGVSAADMRSNLDALGLSIIGCHINPLDVSILPQALEYQAELGNTAFGCDIEFYPYGDLDYVLRRAETFNKIGELARQHGMQFYYHNHFQEFQRFGDEFVYDIILSNTDPDLVKLELDTFWMYRAGQNPIDWMQKYGDRIILIHQKDFPAAGPQTLNLFDGLVTANQNIDSQLFHDVKDPLSFVEIGTGILPIQSIIDTAATLPNLEFIVLEQDHTTLPEVESVSVSMQAFREKFTGIRWD